MTGPDRTHYSPDDEPRYEEMTRAGTAALAAMHARARALAEKTTQVRSTDRQVTVTVTGGGEVTAVRIHPGALRGYSSTRLGDVVTRTVRAAQDQAREEYGRDVERLTPPEVTAALNALSPPEFD